MKMRIAIVALSVGLSFLIGPADAQTPEEASLSSKALPEGVKALMDVPYVTNGHEHQKLDLYLPEASDGRSRPVLVRIHGGAWRHGDKSEQQSVANYVAKGYVAVALNYRLSQEAIFPAQIEDCKAAIRWLRAHAADYHIDPNRIGVWGASAGGHLAALLGTTGNAKQFDTGENLQFSSGVQAVLDFYGPTDMIALSKTAGYEAAAEAKSAPSQLFGGPLLEKEALAVAANPITHISKDSPPFIIFHGDHDPLVSPSQSEMLYAALQKAGIPSQFFLVKGGVHGGDAFKTAPYKQAVEDFLKRYIEQPLPLALVGKP